MSGVPPPGRPSGLSRWAILTAAPALGLLFAVGGCSFDVQVAANAPKAPVVNAVGKDELAQELTDELARKTGQRPDLITCPSDLPGTVGATVRCDLLKAGQRVGTVTATSMTRAASATTTTSPYPPNARRHRPMKQRTGAPAPR